MSEANRNGAADTGPAIVSASRRTDVPALYGEWLRRRLEAGWCEVRHPFSGAVRRVPLAAGDVLGWVFWSRNYAPFLDVLERLWARGDRFLCYLTVTAMPREFEPRGPGADVAVEAARRIAERFGPNVLRWRYDPVLLSDATPPAWHRENFARLAELFAGVARRCVFSFPTMYAKTRRHLSGLGAWEADGGKFGEADLTELAAGLAGLAREHGLALEACCGERWANAVAGIGQARCIDWPALQALGAPAAAGPKRPCKPMRPGCGCYPSVDIGRYDTCSHGCAYCYAVQSPERALANRRAHDPDAAAL